MAKYKVDWSRIGDGEDAAALIDAVARYLSSTDEPEGYVMAAILGIEKVGGEENVRD